MNPIPLPIICGGLSLVCAAAVATLGQAGRLPRYVVVPLVVAFVVTGGMSVLFAGVVFDWTYRIYLETWPLAALPVLLLADAAALYFLIALWAGAGASHWFWRLGAMFGALALLTVVEMVEPMLMLMLGMMPVMLAGLGWKRWGLRGERIDAGDGDESCVTKRHCRRMSLRSAFLAFAIVGLVGVILRSAVHANLFVVWIGLAAESLTFTSLGLAVAAVVVATWAQRLWLVPLTCVVAFVAYRWHYNSMPDWAGWSHVIPVKVRSAEWACLTIFGWVVFSTLVAGTVWLASARRRAAPKSRAQRTLQAASAALLLISLAPVSRVYWALLPRIDRASDGALTSRPLADESTTYEQLVGKNWGLRWAIEARPTDRFDAKLAIAAEILKTPDRVRIDPAEYALMQLADREDKDLETLYLLYYHFDRALWIAASEGKLDEAKGHAQTQMRIVKLLQSSNLPRHAQAAKGLHFITMYNYVDLQPHLSADESRAVLQDSAAFIARLPSVEEQHAAATALRQRCETWRQRWARAMLELTMPRSAASRQDAPGIAEWHQQDRLTRAQHEAVRVRLALELFRTAHGRLPKRLNELTPDILKHLPADPFAAQANLTLLYRCTGDGFELYSRGPDAVDNGGNYGNKDGNNWQEVGYDLDLQFDQRRYKTPFPWHKLPIAAGTTGGVGQPTTSPASPGPPAAESSDNPTPD